MPTLKEYVESSDKTGFYILANVGGSNPVTLQVTPLGETILRKANYEPQETLPSKLVWSMYDIGLSYTNDDNQGEYKSDQDLMTVKEYVRVSNKLTHTERKRFIRVLREYSGPGEAQIKQLIQEIKDSGDEPAGETDSGSDPSPGGGVIGADVESIDPIVNDDNNI